MAFLPVGGWCVTATAPRETRHQRCAHPYAASSGRRPGGRCGTRARSALAMNAKEQVEIELEVDPGVVPGTSLQIVKYPSPILRAENALVTEFDRELVELTKQMFKVMYASRGVGLAAPQVGVNKRVMVFNPKGDAAAWLSEVALVNPRIVEQSGKTELGDEACLSFPGMGGKVDRSVWIKVEAQKPNGKKFKVKYTGWEAIVFQHEYDHLEGVLYIDRLSEPERERVQPRLDELIAEFDGTPAL